MYYSTVIVSSINNSIHLFSVVVNDTRDSD